MSIQEIVTKIQNHTEYNYHMKYISYGYVEAVEVLFLLDDMTVKIELWDSENDTRKYKNGEYEDFEKFIRRKLKEVIKSIKTMRKILK